MYRQADFGEALLEQRLGRGGGAGAPTTIVAPHRLPGCEIMQKQSPPMPVLCGSTTPSTAVAATAASTALPPARSVSMAVRWQADARSRPCFLGNDGRAARELKIAAHNLLFWEGQDVMFGSVPSTVRPR